MERDMRYMQDGRNPYGSEGGYVVSSRGRGRRRSRRGDRGMDYADMNYTGGRGSRGGRRGDMNYTGGRGGYPMGAPDYNYDMARQGEMRGMDGHYPQGQGSTYYPIQAMGTFEGYYGMPEQDYARGGRGRDYGYDMRYNRDYGYPMYEHDYGYGEDYGEKLSDKELDEWCHKLKSQLTEQEKQMFSKENIMQRAKAMGKPMDGFGEKELEVATLMVFTDYKQTIGNNIDLAIKLAYDWLSDKDVKVKGAEKLAVYYDEIVMGGEE